MSQSSKRFALAGVSLASLAAGVTVAWAAQNGAAIVSGLGTGGILGAVGLAGAAGALLLVRRMARQAEDIRKLQTALAARIATFESRLDQVDTDAAPALRGNVAELTAEIGLLGGLMRDLAETVSAHDRAIETLNQARLAPPTVIVQKVPVPVPAPPAAAPQPAPVTAPPVLSPAAPPPAPAAPDWAAGSWPVADVRPAPPPPAFDREPPEDPRTDAILAACMDDRAEIHLQPIVTLPQRRVRMYECLGRLRLGESELMMPAEFLPVLERRNMAAAFDERTIRRALVIARHLAGRGSDALVCCNLSRAAIIAPGFLRGIARILADHPDVAGRLVVEVSQQVIRQLDAERLGALGEVTAAGAGLTIDHVVDFRFDPPSLADRGVRYIKIPARMLLGVEAHRADIDIADLAALLDRAGIQLIVEQVESEDMVRDILDFDIPLAQGFVFAVPRLVRNDVYQAGPVQAEEPEVAVVETTAPAAERKPFRAFLRRAPVA